MTILEYLQAQRANNYNQGYNPAIEEIIKRNQLGQQESPLLAQSNQALNIFPQTQQNKIYQDIQNNSPKVNSDQIDTHIDNALQSKQSDITNLSKSEKDYGLKAPQREEESGIKKLLTILGAAGAGASGTIGEYNNNIQNARAMKEKRYETELGQYNTQLETAKKRDVTSDYSKQRQDIAIAMKLIPEEQARTMSGEVIDQYLPFLTKMGISENVINKPIHGKGFETAEQKATGKIIATAKGEQAKLEAGQEDIEANINRALELNKNSLTPASYKLQEIKSKVSNETSPEYQNTIAVQNIMLHDVVGKLRATFGAQFTEREGEVLKALEGASVNKNNKEREIAIKEVQNIYRQMVNAKRKEVENLTGKKETPTQIPEKNNDPLGIL
jgi:hypothetical protein